MSRLSTLVGRVRQAVHSRLTVTAFSREASSQNESSPTDGGTGSESPQLEPRTARARASVSLYVATFGTPRDTPDATSENDPTDAAESVRD